MADALTWKFSDAASSFQERNRGLSRSAVREDETPSDFVDEEKKVFRAVADLPIA